MMSIKVIFGRNLKYYRKIRKLSQEELSEKVDITPKHLSSLETGAAFVSAELLERLSHALGVSAAILFYAPEEKSEDDSLLNQVDRIIEEELIKTIDVIKLQIRRVHHT